MESITINKIQLKNIINESIRKEFTNFKKEILEKNELDFLRAEKFDKMAENFENGKLKTKSFKNKKDFLNDLNKW